MTPRFFTYARKSPTGFIETKDAKDPIPSLERQEADLYAMASRFPDCQYAGCFRELESAVEVAWDKRPVFSNMLKEMRKGDHLGVWRLDRIERHPLRLATALHALEKIGVTIHADQALGDLPLDLDTFQGRSLAMLLAISADMQMSLHKDATRRGLLWRKQCGLAMGNIPPVGFKFVEVPGKRTRLGNPERRIEWDQEQCAVIREIRRRLLAGATIKGLKREFREQRKFRIDDIPWTFKAIRGGHELYQKLLDEGKELGSFPVAPEAIAALKEREAQEVAEAEAKQQILSITLERERIGRSLAKEKENRKLARERREKDKAKDAEPKPVPEWAVRLKLGLKPFPSSRKTSSSGQAASSSQEAT